MPQQERPNNRQEYVLRRKPLYSPIFSIKHLFDLAEPDIKMPTITPEAPVARPQLQRVTAETKAATEDAVSNWEMYHHLERTIDTSGEFHWTQQPRAENAWRYELGLDTTTDEAVIQKRKDLEAAAAKTRQEAADLAQKQEQERRRARYTTFPLDNK